MIRIQEITYEKKKIDNEISKILKVTSVDGERINAYLKTIQYKMKSNQNEGIKQTSKRKLELSNRFLNKHPTKFLERLIAQPSTLELESRRIKTEVIDLLM